MSDMQRLDGSPVHATLGWLPPPSLPVREPAQVLDRGAGSWPFLYSYKEGGCVVNTAPRQSAYAQAQEIGDALL
jgi:hypothetical protein